MTETVKTPHATKSPIIDVASFQRDILIEEIDLNKAFRNQAAAFAYYATLSFRAMQDASAKKLKLAITESQLDKKIRDDAAESASTLADDDKKVKSPTGKLTEKQIEHSICRDPSYIAITLEYNEAVAMQNLCNNALEAFRQRRDMLIQLGANARDEAKGELFIRS